ncbi:hypothetical protein GGTG_06899 [Gaeumannomyces tritici R3-111a-1]|uniref:Uncharacterized protein n=1 Tax=Gaeumannomyces tritici (strain R3-111a-1) TaxID=644352 RepID=J3P052_GAET3|nr:hypothetical protein GGTG_06899 [Gaeumannomyces tritici R3-111a-1]EJT76985.1 hypothetical protein GGTG_06899 [Gaeumannomyces tritici R3-111a-1]
MQRQDPWPRGSDLEGGVRRRGIGIVIGIGRASQPREGELAHGNKACIYSPSLGYVVCCVWPEDGRDDGHR